MQTSVKSHEAVSRSSSARLTKFPSFSLSPQGIASLMLPLLLLLLLLTKQRMMLLLTKQWMLLLLT